MIYYKLYEEVILNFKLTVRTHSLLHVNLIIFVCRLLIAKENYTVEVKDLMSDMKCPVFFFPTVDKVLRIIHSASGGYSFL